MVMAIALQVCSVPGLGCQRHPGVLPAALACLHWYADTRPDLDASSAYSSACQAPSQSTISYPCTPMRATLTHASPKMDTL